MKKAKSYLMDCIFIIAGSCIYATAVNVFTAPNNIAPGGFTGIGTMLNYLFGTPIGIVFFALNIPVIIWAVIEIGYKLVLKTSFAIVVSSAAIDVFAHIVQPYHGNMILAAVASGVLEGLGLALIFMRGATTGGSDMIARLLEKRFKFLSIGKLMLIVDGMVILMSAFVFKSMESAMYACIDVFVSTKIIDALLCGTDAGTGKIFFVMSDKTEEMGELIMDEIGRGVTYLKARGGYRKTDTECLMCAVRRFDIFRINEIIRRVDPNAFVIVGDAGEITGEGFKPMKSDDRTLKELLGKEKKQGEENA